MRQNPACLERTCNRRGESFHTSGVFVLAEITSTLSALAAKADSRCMPQHRRGRNQALPVSNYHPAFFTLSTQTYWLSGEKFSYCTAAAGTSPTSFINALLESRVVRALSHSSGELSFLWPTREAAREAISFRRIILLAKATIKRSFIHAI